MVDLNGNVAICGGGLQERNISCLQNQGQQPVDKSLCANLPQLPRLQRSPFNFLTAVLTKETNLFSGVLCRAPILALWVLGPNGAIAFPKTVLPLAALSTLICQVQHVF